MVDYFPGRGKEFDIQISEPYRTPLSHDKINSQWESWPPLLHTQRTLAASGSIGHPSHHLKDPGGLLAALATPPPSEDFTGPAGDLVSPPAPIEPQQAGESMGEDLTGSPHLKDLRGSTRILKTPLPTQRTLAGWQEH